MTEDKTKFNFTKQGLEKLPIPASGKRAYYYDLKVRGLGVSLTSKGSITFIVYRKINGAPQRITLGRYPDMSIKNARGAASEINSQIAQGKNPNEEKLKLKKEQTLEEVFHHYLEKHAKKYKKTWEDDVAQYRLYLTSWQKKKLSAINKYDIDSLHEHIGKAHGLYAANRLLALLSVVFEKAIDWGWLAVNPAKGIKKFKEKSRERFLQGDELPRFYEALAQEPNRTLADFFMVSLLTGARRDNVLNMRWQDIDFDNAIWTIPVTKNGDSLRVPLTNQAQEILIARKNLEDRSIWVFPSKTSKSGHLEEPKSAWRRILKKADLQDLRLHDLRRTLGSWQAATGANSYVIQKSLGHKTPQATAGYARLNIDPVRESVERATDAMLKAAKMKKTS